MNKPSARDAVKNPVIKRSIFFLLFICVLVITMALFSMPALSAEFDVTNSPYPIIEAVYDEDVTILNGYIEDSSGNQHNVIQNPSGLNTTFSFRSEPYLGNGDYIFNVESSDRLDNKATHTYMFEVDVPFGIILRAPLFGHSQTTPYDIRIETTEAANCRWSLSSNTFPPNPWFDGEDDSTFQSMHTLAGQIFNERDVWFTCVNSQGEIANQAFYFKVDATAPEIQTDADPNPVVDPGMRATLLTINSNEKVVCWIEGNLVGDSDPDKESTYKTTFQTTINYSDIYNTQRNEFNHDITCRNLAQMETSVTQQVIVQLTSAFSIDVLSPESYTNKDPVPLRVSTPITTSCYYGTDSASTSMNPSSNGKVHSVSISGLAEGPHTYNVRCDSGGTSANTTTSFMVDRTKPTNVSIDAGSSACSSSGLSASFSGVDENGIEFYNYSVWQGSNMIVPWTSVPSSPVSNNFSLTAGMTYEWRMNAVDPAGNKQPAIPVQFAAGDPDSTSCDLNPPAISVEVIDNPDAGGKDIKISCLDEESGCKSNFKYSAIGLDDVCTDYRNSKALDETLFITYGTKVCVVIFDNNDNNATDRILIKGSDGLNPGPGPGTDPTDPGPTDCGNNIIEPGESCDGTTLPAVSCSEIPGFIGGGTLGCTSTCNLDTLNCIPENDIPVSCGDGIISAGELCDGANLGGFECSDFEFTSGRVSCNSACLLDTTRCATGQITQPDNPEETGEKCGNGEVDPGEDCDGSNLGGLRWCDDLGLEGGRLSCDTQTCKYETSACNNQEVDPETGVEIRKTSIWGLLLLIIGLILMTGGGGYLGYKQYYGGGLSFGTHPNAPSQPSQPTMPGGTIQPMAERPKEPTLDDIREKERQKALEDIRKRKKQKERKKLFDEFDNDEEK